MPILTPKDTNDEIKTKKYTILHFLDDDVEESMFS